MGRPPAGTDQHDLTGLTYGAAYTFAAAAVNAVGTGPDSTRCAGVAPIPEPRDRPGAPSSGRSRLRTARPPSPGRRRRTTAAPPSPPIPCVPTGGGSPVAVGYGAGRGRGTLARRWTGFDQAAPTSPVPAATGRHGNPVRCERTRHAGDPVPRGPGRRTPPRPGDGEGAAALVPRRRKDGGSAVTGYLVTTWTYGALRSAGDGRGHPGPPRRP